MNDLRYLADIVAALHAADVDGYQVTLKKAPGGFVCGVHVGVYQTVAIGIDSNIDTACKDALTMLLQYLHEARGVLVVIA